MATTLKLVSKGATGAGLEVSDKTFGRDFNEALVHQVVTAYMNAGRAGTKRQKSKAEVRGGGRKPHSQKGGGRARAGSIRSPIWVGGGRAFAARPRDYSQKVNRKMYRGAMQSMLSELARQDRLIVIESIEQIRKSDITRELARESGFATVKELLEIAQHGAGRKVFLIRFRYVPPGGW